MRISALTAEHRDVKQQWLGDKADLHNRFCQVQALNTQVQGTLKKKDKDFEKLQSQLAKLVKDGNKAQAKPAILLSLPIRKNLSQESSLPISATALLKDAEVLAAKRTIATLDVSFMDYSLAPFICNYH